MRRPLFARYNPCSTRLPLKAGCSSRLGSLMGKGSRSRDEALLVYDSSCTLTVIPAKFGYVTQLLDEASVWELNEMLIVGATKFDVLFPQRLLANHERADAF